MKDLFVNISIGIGLLFSGLGLVFVLGFYVSFLTGYTLSILWEWFFVPSLGFPSIGIAQAVGISITVRYLTGKHKESPSDKRAKIKNKEEEDIAIIEGKKKDDSFKELFLELLQPLVIAGSTLLIGWIVHMFI